MGLWGFQEASAGSPLLAVAGPDIVAIAQGFDTACSGGLGVDGYCAGGDAIANKCCGLCNIVPISGPGSFLAAIVGTFLNLVIALWWKTETPWSLLFQLLGTDAAVISHIHRLAVTTNRISLWHYAFVPLTVISFVPVLIGCCLNRLRYIHGVSTGAELAMHEMIKSERQTKQVHTERSQGKFGSFKRRLHSRHASQEIPISETPIRPSKLSRPPSFVSGNPDIYGKYPKVRVILAQTMVYGTAGHLVLYAAVFAAVFFFVGNTAQENCNNDFNLSGWRIGMGAFAFTFLLIGAAFWACLFTAWMLLRSKRNLGRLSELIKKARKDARRRQVEAGKSSSTSRDAAHRPKGGIGAPESDDEKEEREQERGVADGLDILMYFILVAICHAPERFVRWRASKKARQWWRWGLSFFFYAVWAAGYITVYLIAAQGFLLPGTNPWPYEQINAIVSVIGPTLVALRVTINTKDDWDDTQKELRREALVLEHRLRMANNNDADSRRGRSTSREDIYMTSALPHTGSTSPHSDDEQADETDDLLGPVGHEGKPSHRHRTHTRSNSAARRAPSPSPPTSTDGLNRHESDVSAMSSNDSQLDHDKRVADARRQKKPMVVRHGTV